MGRTFRQTWQIVNQNPLTVLETKSRERLDNLNTILDSKLDYPFRVSIEGPVLTIKGSELQTIKTDGNDGFDNSFKIASSPIQGVYKRIPESTINFFTGATTGVVAPIADIPNMDPEKYVWAGIELREDGKFYVYWGTQSSSIAGATFPLFKTGDSICLVLLKGFVNGGFWRFENLIHENIILFKESNALEIREDVVHKAKAIDLVSQTLPQGSSIVIDNETIVEGDVVLFARSPIEGLYRALFGGGAVFWEKILNPISGSNVQVTGGTVYLRTIWKRLQGIWTPLEIAEAVKEPSGFPNRTDSTFAFNNSTRTFTLRPVGSHFDYFIKGGVWRVASPISITIPNLVGDHFIYLDTSINSETGNYLQTRTTFDNYLLTEKAYVAYIYWTGTEAIILGDERHGISMSGATHRYLHLSVGTVLQSGLDIGSFTETGTGGLNSDAQITLANALLFDEDIDIRIKNDPDPQDFFSLENPNPLRFHEQVLNKSFESDGLTIKHPAAKIPVYYKTGDDGHWEKEPATYFPLKTNLSTGLMSWNKFNSLTNEWELVSASDSSKYITMWIFATNSVVDPVIAIMGQFEYDSLSEAQEKETYQELNTQLFPIKEFKLCYRLIFETGDGLTNDVRSALRHVQDLRISPDTPFASVSVKDHGLLTGLEDPDHPPTALTTAGVVKDGGLSASDIDARNVFDTINKLFGQLRILEHPTNKNRVVITGADRVLNNNTKLSQAIGSLLLSFDGAEIDFSSGRIIYNDEEREDVVFQKPAISENEFRWFSISLATNTLESDNTLSGQILVVPAQSGDSVLEFAPKAFFSAGLKLGQVVIKGQGGTSINSILQENIIQLGVGSGGGGGDGTGDANEILERLKNVFDNSEYEYLTPNIFSITGEEETESATAEYSIVSSNYVFREISNDFISKDMLDKEFLNQEVGSLKDISKVDLYTFYEKDNFDENAVIELSRANGADGTWQRVNSRRIGQSDTFYGTHFFQEENVNPYTQNVQGGNSESFPFEGSENSFYSREFSINFATNIKKITTFIGKNGNPLGRLFCKIVSKSSNKNLLRYSEYFDSNSWTKSNIKVIENSFTAPDGTQTADKICSNSLTSDNFSITQSGISLLAGTAYTFSFYVKKTTEWRWVRASINGSSVAFFDITDGILGTNSGTVNSYNIKNAGKDWWRVDLTVNNFATSTQNGMVDIRLAKNSSSSEDVTGDGTSGIVVWGAQLEVNFEVNPYAPSDLFFVSRSSSASFVDSDGLIKYVENNTERRNFTPSNLSLPSKLLLEEGRANSFEYSEEFYRSYWSKNRTSVLENVTKSPDGSFTADKIIENTETDTHNISRSLGTINLGTTYCFSIFAKASERSVLSINVGDARFGLNSHATFNLSNGTILTTSTGPGNPLRFIESYPNGWYRCILVITAVTTGTDSITFNLSNTNTDSATPNYTGNGRSGLFLWGAQFEIGSYATTYIPSFKNFISRNSTGTFIDFDGLIKNAAIDVARLNYTSDNLKLLPKILLEESRTNLLTYSESFDNVNWIKSSSSVVTNIAVSPSGTLSAEKLVQGAVSGANSVSRSSISFTAGLPYTLSIFAKASENSVIRLGLPNDVFVDGAIRFNTATEQFNNSSFIINSGYQKMANGWYRVWGTAVANVTATGSLSFATLPALNTSVPYLGDGASGIFIWGAQLEEGYYPTSYIPTVDSSVTRESDLSTSNPSARSADISNSGSLGPLANINYVQALSNSINLAGLSAGNKDFDINAVLPAGQYFVVFETDSGYKANYNLSNANRITGSRDTNIGIRYVLSGKVIGLKVKITGATENSSLKGYGILYNSMTSGSYYSEGFQDFRVVFNGFTQNLNEFILPFTPDKRLLSVYEQNTGQVYKHGVFAISGNKIIFPVNTFYKPEQITLLFEQINSINFNLPSATDKAYALMVENNLGSTNPNLDASANGRGIFLRRPDGTLREITIDNEDNIVIYSA
jgi:hypothetical protein